MAVDDDWPDWLQDAQDDLYDFPEPFSDAVELGLGPPDTWSDVEISNHDGWHVEITSDGDTYIIDSNYDWDDQPPDWIWDFYDYCDYYDIDIDVEYKED